MFAAPTDGSSATPRIGRLGRTELEPVTSTHVAWDALPVPRLKPIQALPSLVPTIATLWNFGEYFNWLMNERPSRVCLVMFWLEGLLVTYQLELFMELLPPATVSQTRVDPTIR